MASEQQPAARPDRRERGAGIGIVVGVLVVAMVAAAVLIAGSVFKSESRGGRCLTIRGKEIVQRAPINGKCSNSASRRLAGSESGSVGQMTQRSVTSAVETAQRRVTAHPGEAAAWAALAEAKLHEAGTSEYYDQEAARYTSRGKEVLRQIVPIWEKYLKLSPRRPSVVLARNMAAGVFSEQALNQPAQAVRALQIIVAAEPDNAHLYASLAVSAYQAREVRTGDAASEKALALAPTSTRPLMKLELEKLRKSAEGG